MRAFAYERPADADGAIAAAAAAAGDGRGVRYLGGGTNLVDLMRLEVETPEVLVDVTRVLDDAVVPVGDDGALRIGAGARNSDVAVDRAVRGGFPVLSEALLSGASGQLRNLATVGGNLLQRTRCRYFQDVTKPCNKRAPGSGCPAREGEHRDLAVLGHSEACVATHPSDMAVAMAALDAVVVVRGPGGGERRVPIGELHRLPGDEPARDTTLRDGELIVAVELPGLPAGTRSTYRKVRDRASFAFAVVSVAAVVLPDGGVRIALGGVAHKPWRCEVAEARLGAGPVTHEAVVAAMEEELQAARPLRDNAFKVPLARNLAAATVAGLAEGAGR